MARPTKTINWDLVVKQMEAGLTAKEIAGSKMNIDTFYDRFKKEFGKSFSDYSDDFYSEGDGNLKYTQYAKAISGSEKMLIWLGKNRLGQKDRQEDKGLLSTDITNLLQLAKMIENNLISQKEKDDIEPQQ